MWARMSTTIRAKIARNSDNLAPFFRDDPSTSKQLPSLLITYAGRPRRFSGAHTRWRTSRSGSPSSYLFPIFLFAGLWRRSWRLLAASAGLILTFYFFMRRGVAPHVAVVILSLYDDARTQMRAREAGAAAFVAKHQAKMALLATIRRVVSSIERGDTS
jgi:hypothetical protein